MTDAVAALDRWLSAPSETCRQHLLELLGRMRLEQNEYKQVPFAAVRLIQDWDLLLIEKAVACVLHPNESPRWAYELARDYAERSSSQYPNGLTPASAPLVQDIIEFWTGEAGADLKTITAPVSRDKTASRKRTAAPR